MNLLKIIRDQDFTPNLITKDVGTYKLREAARAVLLDENNEVYLLNVTTHKYHKLPGGGIKKNESILNATKRELLEEVGCQAEIVSELGQIIEYRDFEKLKQISYCFIARQTGSQVNSSLEEDELAAGMKETKANNIEEAISILQRDRPDNLEGKFIKQRDLCFLETAKESLLR